jgi:DNA-binding PucR family transcriptional regulator
LYRKNNMSDSAARFTGLAVDPQTIAALESVLPRMAERAVAAITAEVPAYTDAFSGRMGHNIENAVQTSLGAFLRLATRDQGSDPGPPLSPALEGAYELGRGEARNGRSIDALLSAYRVGAREAWRGLSETAVGAGMSAAMIARFAALVFAFIDQLSASSASGHTDEQATAGRVRQRYLDQLTEQLLAGESPEVLLASAERANWKTPRTLTAVLLPIDQTRGLAAQLNPGTLQITDGLPELDPSESWAVVLIPDADGRHRKALLAVLADRQAIVGPSRPWRAVHASYRRVVRARALTTTSEGALDTDDHLVEILLGADPEAAEDLRRRALAPLAALRPNSAGRLAETLRSWLLHQGQREAVAADLFVHPQTVRYRMNQLRELYGERLSDPRSILELTVALGAGDGVIAQQS